MRNIVNIINFVRAYKPGSTTNLIEPVVKQMELLKKHNIEGTFLLMYGALCEKQFFDLFQNPDDRIEVGFWFEVDQWLAKAAGLEWRGRFPWDWHVNVGFLPGYNPEDRMKLIDAAMKGFKEKRGSYPESVGSWLMDAYSMKYMSEAYHVKAFCICKEQWGTDGYSLWGGYFNQAYYPCVNNMLCPAQREEYQIGTPCFRMLGIDPIYSYDNDFNEQYDSAAVQRELSGLEPYLKDTGGNPAWVDWFMKECFENPSLSFGYTQVGQENSFGWPGMKNGLEYQFEKLEKMHREGKVQVEKLCSSGKWYRRTYSKSAPSVYCALSDWKKEGRKSIWFQSAYYRINLLVEKRRIWIRDLYLFCEEYPERYLETRCPNAGIQFDNLPVADGYLWSGGGKRAGLYFYQNQKEIEIENIQITQEGNHSLLVVCNTAGGQLRIALNEKSLFIAFPGNNGSLRLVKNNTGKTVVTENNNRYQYRHNGFYYCLDTAPDGTGNIVLNFENIAHRHSGKAVWDCTGDFNGEK